MRIGFLVFNLAGMGGTSRAAITQANALARRPGGHRVTLFSVTRSADDPHYAIDPQVEVQWLVDVRPDVEPSLVEHAEGLPPALERELAERPSLLVPPAWDGQFSALTDVALEHRLPHVDLDVLVTVTPGLLAAAVQFAPASTALIHQEHRSTSSREGGLEPLLAFGPRADLVAVLTEPNAEWLRTELGEGAPPVVVVPNALSAGYVPRSRLDQPVILAAGRLVAEKQFGHLVRAFGQIAEDFPDWRLRICGDGGARVQLLAAARKLGLYDRVEIPGAVSDLAGEWAKASVGALCSVAEGFPLVLQEAMAAGVPVVSYDSPTGPRAIIEHEVTGLLVTPGSVDDLAAALRRLCGDHDLRSDLGAAAERAVHRWDPQPIAEQWETLFIQAVRRRSAAGKAGRLAGQHANTPVVSSGTPSDTAAPAGATTETAVAAGNARRTPTAAREVAWRWAVETARGAAGTDWFTIPAHTDDEPVLVVPSDRRRDFLVDLAERIDANAAGATDAPGGDVMLRDPGDDGWPPRADATGALARQLASSAIGRIRLTAAPDPGGVTVEFWTRRGAELVAPRPNRYTGRVPIGATTARWGFADVETPTLPMMLPPVVGEVDFEVDVVYTWVDGSDPAWLAAKDERLAAAEGTAAARAASGKARFENRDELRYSLRSLHAFAPWVRHVYVVTAGQRPAWLLDDDRLSVVDHRDILPADALPTFNSHAIETGLHHIEGLAEHFVYVNDDVFLGRPVRPELFFTGAGQFAAFPSPHVIGLPDHADAPYLGAAINNRRLLAEAFGVTITHTMAHTPHPQRRSVLAEIEQRFPDQVAATARSPFRSSADISLLSNFAQHYGLITGSAVQGSLAHSFVDLAGNAVGATFDRLSRERDQDSICIGDHHDFAFEIGKVETLLSGFFEGYFPVASPWERPTH